MGELSLILHTGNQIRLRMKQSLFIQGQHVLWGIDQILKSKLGHRGRRLVHLEVRLNAVECLFAWHYRMERPGEGYRLHHFKDVFSCERETHFLMPNLS